MKKNNSFELQRNSKFDLLNCTDRFVLIQDQMISSAELKIDDKVIPLDKNGMAINTGMKIGSKISLKIKKSGTKALKVAFSAVLSVNGKKIMFYSA